MLGRKASKKISDTTVGAVAEEFAPRRSDRETLMYRVSSGDTLIGIAKQFVVDVDDLARDNGLDSEDKLREGALLRLMVKRKVLDRWKKKTDARVKNVKRSRKVRKKKAKSGAEKTG
jgi:membrane-bound lytic murein transglycosylase D